MRKALSEIIETVATQKTKAARVEALQKHDHVALRQILGMALDPRIEWDLPEGRPPFKSNPVEKDLEGHLYNEMRKMYIFLKAPNPIFGDECNRNLKPERREWLFIQFLESLSPDDAELILCAKEKRLPVRGITAKLVNEAFPGLMPE